MLLDAAEHRIRPLEAADHEAYLTLLEQFRPTGAPIADRSRFEDAYRRVVDNGRVWVCVDGSGALVGTISVHIEQKFIHDLASYARIEDLFVRAECRGMGVASALIEAALSHCREKAPGLRKVSLTCADDLVPFYAGRGFATESRQNDLSSLL